MRFRRMIARVVAASVLTLGGLGVVMVVPATPAQAIPECNDGALYSEANHKYVSAELNYAGGTNAMLRARADSVGLWERFEICKESIGSVHFSIRSLANGMWVAAEMDYTGFYYGMLRARSSTIAGTWEKFCACSEIQSEANWKWVSAELGYGGLENGMLRARADSDAGPWEQWTFK